MVLVNMLYGQSGGVRYTLGGCCSFPECGVDSIVSSLRSLSTMSWCVCVICVYIYKRVNIICQCDRCGWVYIIIIMKVVNNY